MNGASHRGGMSKLPAPIHFVLGHPAPLRTRQTGRSSKAKQRRRFEGPWPRGERGAKHVERKVSVSFRAVKRCSTARFVLVLGVPTARGMLVSCPVCVCARSVIIILPSYVGSLH